MVLADLQAVINPGLTKAVIGLGWDTNKYSGGHDFDLDASAFLVDAHDNCVNDLDRMDDAPARVFQVIVENKIKIINTVVMGIDKKSRRVKVKVMPSGVLVRIPA